MLCATDIMKRPVMRIGHIGKNINLPRPVRMISLAAGGIGFLLGALIGGIAAGLPGIIYAGGLLAVVGVGLVTYSPLKGETLFTWLGLSLRNRRRQVSIDGVPVRLAVGICPIDNPIRGLTQLMPGAIHVNSDQWDERGVLRSAGNWNLDTEALPPVLPTAQVWQRSPYGTGRSMRGSIWYNPFSELPTDMLRVSSEQMSVARVLAIREEDVKYALFGEDAPLFLTLADHLVTKDALAKTLGLPPTQVLLGDNGLPGTITPLPQLPDGRHQLHKASSRQMSVELAKDVLNYATGATGAWLTRRPHETESEWARRLFHFKVEVSALDPETGKEVDWLDLSGINTSTENGLAEVDRTLDGEQSRLDDITVELPGSALTALENGLQVLNALDALNRTTMRGDAAVERDRMLSDAQERADIAGAQFAATARALRETASSLASHLTTGHSDSQFHQVQRLRGQLSEQADTLRMHREDVSVYSAELADSYRVVKAVNEGDITTLSKLEEGASQLVRRARESMAGTESRFQQLLAPFFRNDLSAAELKAAAEAMSVYLQSQIRDAATALSRARKVRSELEESMASVLHEQASASARTKLGNKPRRAADVFAEVGATSFPD
jgi:hypothetical protein